MPFRVLLSVEQQRTHLRTDMKEVPEGSTSYVQASPVDEDGDAVTPSAMRYRIDCLTTGTEILGWTSVASPTSQTTIEVTTTQNRIVNCSNRRERRQMVVETTSAGDIRNDTVDWQVRNIRGVR